MSLRALMIGLLSQIVAFSSTPVVRASEPTAAKDELAATIPMNEQLRRARDAVFPTLVHIQPVVDVARGGRTIETALHGSGVVVSKDGIVVTNFHVAGTAKRLVCTLSDKRRCGATRIGADAATDLAIVQLDLAELGVDEIPHASFATEDALEVGDFVVAMGSPLGLSRSLSLGVVSCLDRDLGILELDGGQQTGLYNTWIQTDAAINPGNSGGPLVDLTGRVVGINTRGFRQAMNLGFAIPADVVVDVMLRVLRDGRVVRSQLGVTMQPVPATSATNADVRGGLIASVEPGSVAETAGWRAGDVLLSIDGTSVTIAFPEDLPRARRTLADLPVERAVAFELSRDGERIQGTCTADELDPPPAQDESFVEYGITLRALTKEECFERFLDESGGVLVTGVRAGGLFARTTPKLQSGDVLLA
ncbi:MAG: trypsin-like peptidase domain-containing protein, partial [Planctomycetes bacterium]|nr:trypsin-like peptidase domain-containing protein [Planctomycetota bacterium]